MITLSEGKSESLFLYHVDVRSIFLLKLQAFPSHFKVEVGLREGALYPDHDSTSDRLCDLRQQFLCPLPEL